MPILSEKILKQAYLLNKGERIDFVLNTNEGEDEYWIKVRGEGECQSKKIYQRAILSYEGSANKLNTSLSSSYQDTYRDGTVS